MCIVFIYFNIFQKGDGEHFDDMLEELGGLGKWGTSSRQGNNEFLLKRETLQ